ncbi:MAG TPA: hypothetical protein VFJ05_07050 [Nitrososphaeraceae archaeon]|nr:hypothetical protein [Nitrososphaeraceae archaeon]
MELYKVQLRKTSQQQRPQEQPSQQQVKLTRDGKIIHFCRHCDVEILFTRNKAGKLIIADARHFFTPLLEGEEYVRHLCTNLVNDNTFRDRD